MPTPELLSEYKNGNYLIKIFSDGTKEREYDDAFPLIPIFPESIDVKLTNYCDAGCKFCFEDSTKNGLHSDRSIAMRVFDRLPAGTELAFGGGNPLDYPYLDELLNHLKLKGIIANLTVNALHVNSSFSRLYEKLKNKSIHGLGISYARHKLIELLPFVKKSNNIVFHLIAGVHTIEDAKLICNSLKDKTVKILILGYKTHGRGVAFHSEIVKKNLQNWKDRLHELFNFENLILSFDNRGLEQLNVKQFFTEENWNKIYMGDDGNFTFYISLVDQEYAATSTEKNRIKILDQDDAVSMFAKIRTKIGLTAQCV
jgi:organic radical activating enzyme